MTLKNHGFSLPETLLTLILAGILFSSVFYIISISNRTSAGSYHLFLAEQLSREPLEILRAMKKDCLFKQIQNEKVANLPLDKWHTVEQNCPLTNIKRSKDSVIFERMITLRELKNPGKNPGILVQVKVRPVESHKNSILSPGKEIVSSCILIN